VRTKNKPIFFGGLIFAIGGIILFIERITNTGISAAIGKLYCGESYLKTTGQPGDGMCGFNMDMVVGLICFFLILAGLFFIIIGIFRMIMNRAKN
jgi:dipeptide/tripeptide permease